MKNTPEFMVRLTHSAVESLLDLSRFTKYPNSSLIIPVNILQITGAKSTNDYLRLVSILTPFGSAVLIGEHEKCHL